MRVAFGDRFVAGSDNEAGLQAGFCGGVQFFEDVAEEEDLARLNSGFGRDFAIAVGFAFAARLCVVVA